MSRTLIREIRNLDTCILTSAWNLSKFVRFNRDEMLKIYFAISDSAHKERLQGREQDITYHLEMLEYDLLHHKTILNAAIHKIHRQDDNSARYELMHTQSADNISYYKHIHKIPADLKNTAIYSRMLRNLVGQSGYLHRRRYGNLMKAISKTSEQVFKTFTIIS